MFSRSLGRLSSKYKYIGVFTAIAFAAFFYRSGKVSVDEISTSSSVSDIPEVLASANSTVIDLPISLEIPIISLKSDIEIAGLDPDGLMSVPAEGVSVSWYKYGPKPGQTGNSVIAGHYDTSKGPAIFYRLREIKVGDSLFVTDVNGIVRRFEVYETEIVRTEDFDVQKVYGDNTLPALNLITCHGNYDSEINTYNQRLIVYSHLKP